MSAWPEIDFRDLVSDETGGNTKTLQSDYLPAGKFPIVDQGQSLIGGYTNDAARVCRAELPVIIFGDHTKCFKFIDFPFCLGADGTKVLRPKQAVDERYLYYALQRIHIPDAGYSRHFKYLKEGKIPLPAIEEQKRIAAILDQADELFRKRQRSIARLNQLSQAIFQEMFEAELSSLDRTALGELVEEFRYGTSNKASEGGGHPTLRIPNVVGGCIDATDLKFVPLSDAEFNRLRLVDGDVLFVRTNGNPDYVGRSAVFTLAKANAFGAEESGWAYASYLIRARPNPKLLNSWFLQAYLSHPQGKRALKERSKTSAGQFNINTEGLGSIPMPKVHIERQMEFEKAITSLDPVISSLSVADRCFETLFRSLQHRAFRGEL
ncbi:hypothetical protein HHL26_15385 [Sphingobium sp. TB-6]|uniref:restriction endonuclease subunit S n=1 Tax=Sphingobium sp. TB-6 TaxID=2728850 RepID=UPI00146E8754|nr:restriction endonuclease subunit S [Sphingobium sp. TB-6]NML90436.1 hypothetical protein [Sphingobium sp. TB-6]